MDTLKYWEEVLKKLKDAPKSSEESIDLVEKMIADEKASLKKIKKDMGL